MLIKEFQILEQAALKSNEIDRTILAIAKKHLPTVETLDERGADSLDFHDVGVVGLKRALQAAFIAGVKFAEDGKK